MKFHIWQAQKIGPSYDVMTEALVAAGSTYADASSNVWQTEDCLDAVPVYTLQTVLIADKVRFQIVVMHRLGVFSTQGEARRFIRSVQRGHGDNWSAYQMFIQLSDRPPFPPIDPAVAALIPFEAANVPQRRSIDL